MYVYTYIYINKQKKKGREKGGGRYIYNNNILLCRYACVYPCVNLQTTIVNKKDEGIKNPEIAFLSFLLLLTRMHI